LRHFNLADSNTAMVPVDAGIIDSLKTRWKLLR
jgi:hypothetical protein